MGVAPSPGARMSSFNPFLLRVRYAAMVLALAPVAARWVGIGAVAVLAVTLFFRWTSLGGEYVVTACVFVLVLFLLAKNLWSAARTAGWETLAVKWGVNPTDVFHTAYQLAESETKSIFHERALDQAQSIFPVAWIRRMWEPRWGWDYALLIGGVGLWGAAFLAGGLSPRRDLEVVPGNARFARGADVLIQVRSFRENARTPQLEVKGLGGQWENRPLALSPDGRYGAILTSLRDPLSYRVREGLFQTRSFKLTPFDPPHLVRLTAQVTPPPYMGKKTETIHDLLSIKVWAGSFVQWRLTLNPAGSLPRLSEGPPLKKAGGEWTWEERIDRSFRRQLWAVRDREAETAVAELVVDVDVDQPPTVTMLGPSENVNADVQDQIQITVEVSDDTGLRWLDFVWRINEGSWRRNRWEELTRGTLDKWVERPWDLAPFLLNHGDRVDFYLEAQDWCVPPGRGQTLTRSVNVLDSRLDQLKLQDELADFQRSLLERVNEQRAVLADLRGPTNPEGLAVSTPNWSSLLTDQRQMARRLSSDIQRLEELLDRMENSESVDPDTLMDYHTLAEGLGDVAQYDVPETDRALSAADKTKAEKAMNQLVSRLEAMQRIGEASLREQQTRGLVRDHGDLKIRAEHLVQSLSSVDALSRDQREQFQKTVQALEAAVKRIQEKLEKLQSAHEESERGYRKETLRFDRVSDALERLGAALDRSDGADALSAAKEALDELKEIERQLAQSGAGGDGLQSGGDDDQDDETIRMALETVKRLADRQEHLQSGTMAVVDTVRSRRGMRQQEALNSLRTAVTRWQSEMDGRDNPFLRMAVSDIQRALRAGDGASTYKALLRVYDLAAANAAGDPKETDLVYSEIAAESKRIGDELGQKEISISDQEKVSLSSQSKEQGTLAGDTRRTSDDLRASAFESGVISPRAARFLDDAVEAMGLAGEHLVRSDPEPAAEYQTTALDHLRNAESKLNEALSNRRSPSLKGGRGRLGGRSIRIGGQRVGGPVSLPKKEDFRSPGTFRQDIIDAMKEPVPPDQQPAVQDYYRHWVK